MNINEKANVLVELGMVRLTAFDTTKRVIGADVAARNLEVAQVRYVRAAGFILVPVCHHKSPDGPTHDHECEGHAHGHVCYHARAGLMMAAAVGGLMVAFFGSEDEARTHGGTICRVMVPGHQGKQVWAAIRRK